MSSAKNPLVRVKDPSTGAEYNASRIFAEKAGLTVLDKPTHDRYGRVVPAKTDPLRQSGGKKSAAKSAETKES